MKSRTSYFNGTLFKKNLTRFAPVWAVYSIILLLFMTSFAGLSSEYFRCMNAADLAIPMAAINLCYAFLLGQLFFGDLFSPRMCNMIHAMPLRRETIYGTNVLTALVCSLVPNLVYALVMLPFLGSGWIIAPYWFAAVTMQFLFFFGTAAFSAMLSGNRLAMTAVYVLVNFLSLLFLWFAKTLFAPLLFGIRVISDAFYLFCPAYKILDFYQLINVRNVSEEAPVIEFNGYDAPTAVFETGEYVTVTTGAGWGYLAICAVIGIVLTVIALEMYRRRKLEAAGDFMAVKAVEPVFLVLFTLGVGAFFQLFSEAFGTGAGYLFLAVGIVVGFFGGLMLLRKTTRVFGKKSFGQLAVLSGTLALILVLTWLDPLGFTRRVPEVQDVESVTVGTSYSASERIWNSITLTEQQDIQAIIDVHRFAIGEDHQNISIEGNNIHYAEIGIEYQLKDGSVLSRYYAIPILSEPGETLRAYSSTVECVTQMSEAEFRELEERIYYIYTGHSEITVLNMADLDVGELLDAVIADCRAGNMAQEGDYHYYQHGDDYATFLQLDYMTEEGFEYGISFTIYESCTNTLRWLAEHGLYYSDAPKG